jgi:hypothetical protein
LAADCLSPSVLLHNSISAYSAGDGSDGENDTPYFNGCEQILNLSTWCDGRRSGTKANQDPIRMEMVEQLRVVIFSYNKYSVREARRMNRSMIGYIGEAVRKLAFAGSGQDRFPAAAAAAADMSHTWHLGAVVASCLAMPEVYCYLNHFRTFQTTDDNGPFIERLLQHLVEKLIHNDILKPVPKSVLRASMDQRTRLVIDVMGEINLMEDLLKYPEAN